MCCNRENCGKSIRCNRQNVVISTAGGKFCCEISGQLRWKTRQVEIAERGAEFSLYLFCKRSTFVCGYGFWRIYAATIEMRTPRSLIGLTETFKGMIAVNTPARTIYCKSRKYSKLHIPRLLPDKRVAHALIPLEMLHFREQVRSTAIYWE